MKYHVLIIVLLFCCVALMQAQVSNLTVCGSDTNFTFESGSAVSWQYNVSPNGATATAELWLDVNLNGSIDTAIDKNRFTFNQTDGSSGSDGPGDMDGSVNGVVTFAQPVGLAPGNYVFRVTQGGSSLSVKGTITHLPSPAHTVSGTVTPPSGQSAANIFMQIQPSIGGDNKPFWEAVTDDSGNFAIEMDGDTAGNPWKLRFADNYNPFPGLVSSPTEHTFDMIGNPNGYTFTFGSAAAKVVGFLKSNSSSPLPNTNVYLNRYSNSSSFNISTQTDANGYFEFALSNDDLSNESFILGSNFDKDDPSPEYLAANKTISGIHNGDSLYYDLTAYVANATISGQVLINGTPANFRVEVSGGVPNEAWTSTWSDSTTGNYTLFVSFVLSNWNITASNLPGNYVVGNSIANAGETGVNINITVTDVREREKGIPSTFSLGQNYPNPFNPATKIDYDVPVAGNVRLSVYDVLGKEVLTVVNQEQVAGKYTATIDASSLESGVYFYRLTAGTHTQTKKLLLMK